MTDTHSLTQLLSQVKRGEEQAVQDLFARCYSRVSQHAEKRLRGTSVRTFDADDITSSVLTEFLSRARNGDFLRLECRSDVWQLLLMLIGDHVRDSLRRERALKRGGASTMVSISDIGNALLAMDDAAFATMFEEAMLRLPSDSHRRIVTLLMEGYTHSEIAERLEVSTRTVYRRCDEIRTCFDEYMNGPR